MYMNVSTGQWLNDDCDTHLRCYLCKFLPKSNEIGCAPGLLPGPYGCYALTDALKFTDAVGKCQEIGGCLAFAKNHTIQQTFNSLNAIDCDWVWLGATRLLGSWRWLDGTPVTYANWTASGEFLI